MAVDAHAAASLLDFAENAGPGVRGLDAKAVFRQLDEQYGDLKLALQWFIDQRRTDDAFRLASALVAFWMATKRVDEGSTWFDEVLALPGLPTNASTTNERLPHSPTGWDRPRSIARAQPGTR